MRARLGPVGFGLLVVAVIVAPLVASHYRTFQLAFVAIYLIALLGLNLLTGFTGQISLGHGAFMGVGAYVTTILVVDHGWNDLLTLPVAGVVTGIAGLAFAVIFGSVSTRRAGTAFAMISLGLAELVASSSLILRSFFGGEEGEFVVFKTGTHTG